MIRSLADPSALWRHIFENQLDESQRAVLLVLATLPNTVVVGHLREACESLLPNADAGLGPDIFTRALRIMDGVFIHMEQAVGAQIAAFANPGLRDYVWDYAANRPSISRRLVEAFVYGEQFDKAARPIRPGASSLLATVPTWVAVAAGTRTLESRTITIGNSETAVTRRRIIGPRMDAPLERRLLNLLRYADSRSTSLASDVLAATAQKVVARISLGTPESDDLVDLVEWVHNSLPPSAEAALLYDTTVARVRSQLGTGHSFALLKRLLALLGTSTEREEEDLRASFLAYAEQRLGEGLATDNYEEAAQALADVADQLDAFSGSPLYLDTSELEEWVGSLVESDDYEDDYPRRAAIDTDDGSVDDLFATLSE